jgi:demethylmenaquinone methyltransferase/2-methoxy-6-polyprenyl-1,4-benzoquinol methylase
VVRSGGTVALSFWSAQRLLPSSPGLEARLSATSGGTAPFRHGMRPDRQAFRALSWLRAAGLVDRKAQYFAATAHAPLDADAREALSICFLMFWAVYEHVCLPNSPGFILAGPDY